MKKIMTVIVCAIISLAASAQNSAVYYSAVSDNLSIGLGFDMAKGEYIISFVEDAKTAPEFTLSVVSAADNSVTAYEIDKKDVNVMPKSDNENYYEYNVRLSVKDFMEIVASMDGNDKVVINGQAFDSSVLTGEIRQLAFNQMMQARPERPAMQFRMHGFRPMHMRG